MNTKVKMNTKNEFNNAVVRILLNADFTALRQGKFVKADESAGEFIYVTNEPNEFTKGQFLDIAAANGAKVSKDAKRDKMKEVVEQHLLSLNLPEIAKMTDQDTAKEIIEEGFNAGLDDDAIMMKMVEAGISFMKTSKLFKQITEESGLRLSNKARGEQIKELLAEIDLANVADGREDGNLTGEDVQKTVDHIVQEVADTNEKQALSAVRRHLKALKLEIPKMRKKSTGAGGFAARADQWMLENVAAETSVLVEWLEEQGKSEAQVKKFVNRFEFAKTFSAAANS